MVPEGRSAWFVAVCLVVFGSVGLSTTGLTALRGAPLWIETETPVPTATALASHEPVATPPPIHTTTPIPTQPPPPAPTPTADPLPEEVEYVVVGGDGLGRIAQRFGVSSEAIAERNNLVPPYRLEVGQVLLIPNAE